MNFRVITSQVGKKINHFRQKIVTKNQGRKANDCLQEAREGNH